MGEEEEEEEQKRIVVKGEKEEEEREKEGSGMAEEIKDEWANNQSLLDFEPPQQQPHPSRQQQEQQSRRHPHLPRYRKGGVRKGSYHASVNGGEDSVNGELNNSKLKKT